MRQPLTAGSTSRPAWTRSLHITDLRIATLDGVPFRSTLLRIDTNQGISSYGEGRDQASKTYALMLKSRQVGHPARQGGAGCGVEMALLDLAGKAYEVPCHALVGGQFRDSVRCYADTTPVPGARQADTKRIGDYAGEHGIAMALHLRVLRSLRWPRCTSRRPPRTSWSWSITPLTWPAGVTWSPGRPSPLTRDGSIEVPGTPGLGFRDITPEARRERLNPHHPVFFNQPTAAWDREVSHDRLWS